MTIIRHGYAKQRRNGSTRAWRNTRAELISQTGPGELCAICGQPLYMSNELDVDHIQPVADLGRDDRYNLRVVHRTCNRKRGRA